MASEHATEKADRDPLLAGLNPEQKKAVLLPGGPLLILAGAGSGKTRVITHRIAWLTERLGVPGWRILAITFTNKAAAEMKSRTAALVGDAAASMWIGTFHTMMLRILRRAPEKIGFRPGFAILDVDDQKRVLKELLRERGLSESNWPLRELQSTISSAKSELITPESYAKRYGKVSYLAPLADLYARYCAALKALNAMDFDDILLYAVKLLQEHEELRLHYSRRFLHVLVDEYQDTNRAQYELVRLLAAEHRNLAVVGDDDQSIYRFRGADIRNILDFEKDYPDATVIRLEQNYRSTKNILDAANQVIAKNEKRKAKRLWTAGEKGDLLEFYLADNYTEEAAYVADDIARRLKTTPASEIAILYRVTALTRSFEAALTRRGLAYRIFGGQRFFDRKEVRDVIAYLRLIADPDDDLAFTRIVNEPRRGIGDQTLATLSELARAQGLSLFALARRAGEQVEVGRSAAPLTRFVTLIEGLRQRLDQEETTLAGFIADVEAESGLERHWQLQAERDLTALTRLENMRELISDALEFEKSQLATADRPPVPEEAEWGDGAVDLSPAGLLAAYLERTALFSDQDRSDDGERITLMTVHSAKGLEFSQVYLVGMENGLFPGYQAEGQPEELEEERRLCYVAITRAKHRLTLTAARARLLYGRTKYNDPSPFLADIPDALIYELGGGREAEIKPAAPGSTLFDVVRSRPAEKKPASGGLNLKKLAVGRQVRHRKHGLAELLAITETGDDAILRVRFADGSVRRFLASSSEWAEED